MGTFSEQVWGLSVERRQEHGLLRPSFVPSPEIRRVRMLTRYRQQLMGDRTREATRLELMLEDASIKLSSVASSLTTVSARAMLGALIAGERDPRALAQLAKGRMRVEIPELTEALTGHFDAGHAQLARAILDRLDRVEAALAELDAVLEAAFAPWARQLELLQTIPGVGPRVAQVTIAETGADMSRFPSAAHLAAWAGLAPGIYESAGKRSRAGARHGNKWLNHMLVEAAGSVARIRAPTTSPRSTPGSPPAAAWAAPRSPSPTRSWSRRTTCSATTSPIGSWAPPAGGASSARVCPPS